MEPLAKTLSEETEETAFALIMKSALVSPETRNVWLSIEDYFKAQFLSNDKIGKTEVVIIIQNDGQVFINYGCNEGDKEVPTNLSISDALDIIKLSSINGLNTDIYFPTLNLKERNDPKALIFSLEISFTFN